MHIMGVTNMMWLIFMDRQYLFFYVSFIKMRKCKNKLTYNDEEGKRNIFLKEN